jgi:predicted TIM-barrel fold metal-dependent hydrolase
MNERLYFDCNASFGPYPGKPKEARWTKQHLLDDLDLAGIAGALVYHRLALDYDPLLANLRLIEEIGDDRDRLFPCWVVLPALSPEFPGVDELLRRMEEHDVRAVRLEPQRFGVPLKERVWGELRDALRERNVLCVIPTPTYGGELRPLVGVREVGGLTDEGI